MFLGMPKIREEFVLLQYGQNAKKYPVFCHVMREIFPHYIPVFPNQGSGQSLGSIEISKGSVFHIWVMGDIFVDMGGVGFGSRLQC